MKKVRWTRKLNTQVPLNLSFRDEAGKPVQLHEYFGRKPVMLVLIQYRCTMLCSEEMKSLLLSLQELKFTAGDQFDLVTVSIDHREQPDLAATYKASYLKEYGRLEAESGWHFLTGDESAIRRLSDAVGFHFTYDAQTDQFMHPAGVIILTPAGRVSHYFYSVVYPPRDLRLALVEASKGKIGSPLDIILLICYHYNPLTGKYSVTLMGLLRLASIATVLALCLGVGVMSLRSRRQALGIGRQVPPPNAQRPTPNA